MPVQLAHYPFDYHTHFWGILPVRPKQGSIANTPCVERAVATFYAAAHVQVDGQPMAALDIKRRIFALCVAQAKDTLSTWITVNRRIIRNTASANASFQAYLRGECFVENALLGRTMLLGFTDVFDLFPEADVDALEAALTQLEAKTLALTIESLGNAAARHKLLERFQAALNAMRAAGTLSQIELDRLLDLSNNPATTLGALAAQTLLDAPDYFYKADLLKAASSIYAYYDFFNDQMLSANAFTPFDDAYVGRGALKNLAPIRYNNHDYLLRRYLVDETRAFYAGEHIDFTQISIGSPGTDPQPGEDQIFDAMNAVGADAWAAGHKVLYHNVDHNIGSDPGRLYTFMNDSIRDYRRVDTPFYQRVLGIDFLGAENVIDFETLFHVFNSFAGTLNGVGGDVRDHKRKFTLRIHCGEGSGTTPHNRSVLGYQVINSSIGTVFTSKSTYAGFLARLSSFGNGQPQANRPFAWPNVTRLMDKVFSGSFVDMRFNIFSQKTHDRVSSIAETNMMNLFHAATKTDAAGQYLYGPGSAFDTVALRLGHGYHARQFVQRLSKLPGLSEGFANITFDTNLGSNFITGSTTEFNSIDDFERAKGIRTLTSYAPARYVMRAIDAVFGRSRLSDQMFERGDFPMLIGSDGQGIEHTDLARENVRAFLLTILRTGLTSGRFQQVNLLDFRRLTEEMGMQEQANVLTGIRQRGLDYWQQTVQDAVVGGNPIPISGTAWVVEKRVEPMAAGAPHFDYTSEPEFDVHWEKQHG